MLLPMFHVKHPWEASASEIGVPLDAGQGARLDTYLRLLLETAVPMGMVASGDEGKIPQRHILDSLRAAPLIDAGSSVVDLGSGAGLPGIPLAIGCPRATFLLTEVRRNRAAFLELVVDTLRLANATVYPSRIEDLEPACADVVIARAFAEPALAWRAARVLLHPGGRFLYWAGRRFDPSDLPPDVAAVTVQAPLQLAEAGPVVIMSAL